MSTSKIYTKTGDKGKTSLLGGARVSKSDLRLDAYGTLDELNSQIGKLLCVLKDSSESLNETCQALNLIQSDLFVIGSRLACEDAEMLKHLAPLHSERTTALEQQMDGMSAKLTPLKNFVLPGGHIGACEAHVARTIARRAERICTHLFEHAEISSGSDLEQIVYINRLSDYFFVLARYINLSFSISEPIWKP
jgi:cob(I)alamin adenosyltransferase